MGGNQLRSLQELEAYIQEFHTVKELDTAFRDIFSTCEETAANIRQRTGEFARIFKFAAEELYPLLKWLELRRPRSLARMVKGNQPYDAEVKDIETQAIERVEIGRAVDGEQDFLQSKVLSECGRASPNSTYKNVGKGPNKKVVVVKDRIVGSSAQTVRESLSLIEDIAKKKAAKKYAADTTILLFLDIHTPLFDENLDRLRDGAASILASHEWKSDKVDVLCGRNGLLACRHGP